MESGFPNVVCRFVVSMVVVGKCSVLNLVIGPVVCGFVGSMVEIGNFLVVSVVAAVVSLVGSSLESPKSVVSKYGVSVVLRSIVGDLAPVTVVEIFSVPVLPESLETICDGSDEKVSYSAVMSVNSRSSSPVLSTHSWHVEEC